MSIHRKILQFLAGIVVGAIIYLLVAYGSLISFQYFRLFSDTSFQVAVLYAPALVNLAGASYLFWKRMYAYGAGIIFGIVAAFLIISSMFVGL